MQSHPIPAPGLAPRPLRLEALEDRRVFAVGATHTLLVVIPVTTAPSVQSETQVEVTTTEDAAAVGVKGVSDTATPAPAAAQGTSSTGDYSLREQLTQPPGIGQSSAPNLAPSTPTTPPPAVTPLPSTFLASTLVPLASISTQPTSFPLAETTVSAAAQIAPLITEGATGPMAGYLIAGRAAAGSPGPVDATTLAKVELSQILGTTLPGVPGIRAVSDLSGGNGGQTVEAPANREAEPRKVPPAADVEPMAQLEESAEAHRSEGDLEVDLEKAFDRLSPLEGIAECLVEEGSQGWLLGTALVGTVVEITRNRTEAVEKDRKRKW